MPRGSPFIATPKGQIRSRWAADQRHGGERNNGTTSIKTGSGDIKPSKAAIVAAKVLIANGFEPGKGLGRRLDGMANPVAVQENPRRVELGYRGAARKAKSGRKAQSKQ
ncbi:hypothetical protein CR513_46450, partial [Mucuna pruriens]